MTHDDTPSDSDETETPSTDKREAYPSDHPEAGPTDKPTDQSQPTAPPAQADEPADAPPFGSPEAVDRAADEPTETAETDGGGAAGGFDSVPSPDELEEESVDEAMPEHDISAASQQAMADLQQQAEAGELQQGEVEALDPDHPLADPTPDDDSGGDGGGKKQAVMQELQRRREQPTDDSGGAGAAESTGDDEAAAAATADDDPAEDLPSPSTEELNIADDGPDLTQWAEPESFTEEIRGLDVTFTEPPSDDAISAAIKSLDDPQDFVAQRRVVAREVVSAIDGVPIEDILGADRETDEFTEAWDAIWEEWSGSIHMRLGNKSLHLTGLLDFGVGSADGRGPR